MLPSLATTLTNLKTLPFPLIVQPKIDGVRGWNPKGILLGRSMETHANKYTTNRFSSAELAGMDRVIGFDMGGTSTDVSHYAGEFEREF